MKVSKEIMKGIPPEGEYRGEHTASWIEQQWCTTSSKGRT